MANLSVMISKLCHNIVGGDALPQSLLTLFAFSYPTHGISRFFRCQVGSSKVIELISSISKLLTFSWKTYYTFYNKATVRGGYRIIREGGHSVEEGVLGAGTFSSQLAHRTKLLN